MALSATILLAACGTEIAGEQTGRKNATLGSLEALLRDAEIARGRAELASGYRQDNNGRRLSEEEAQTLSTLLEAEALLEYEAPSTCSAAQSSEIGHANAIRQDFYDSLNQSLSISAMTSLEQDDFRLIAAYTLGLPFNTEPRDDIEEINKELNLRLKRTFLSSQLFAEVPLEFLEEQVMNFMGLLDETDIAAAVSIEESGRWFGKLPDDAATKLVSVSEKLEAIANGKAALFRIVFSPPEQNICQKFWESLRNQILFFF